MSEDDRYEKGKGAEINNEARKAIEDGVEFVTETAKKAADRIIDTLDVVLDKVNEEIKESKAKSNQTSNFTSGYSGQDQDDVRDFETHESKTADKEGHVVSGKAPPPVGPYPHARAFGQMLFLSGVGPRQAGTKEIPGLKLNDRGEIVAEDVRLQTRACIENIKAILEDSGSSIDRVLDVQVFLTNMKRDFKAFNEIYGEYFEHVGATRTTVEVSSLPTPICVELKVIATLP